MKKLLPIICVAAVLFSCKKDKLPYNDLQGKWREARYEKIVVTTDGKTIISGDTSTYVVLNFQSKYSGVSDGGDGPFGYSLKTLKFHYSAIDNRSWNIGLPHPDTLTLTEINNDLEPGMRSRTDITYFSRIK
ncbi:hypothetical protein [Mucilaginibacter celer]|uniref:Uncharacterized protein n=1 Tax=Mucilaginibacter celer TaxID=2305508 RepID=A0A494VR43_9SPHI|nr:hypothetical protein [Mucilaginibacter celer]AYL96919.1 hypothetical protein HYN43_017110 [Mucilaginibacter celer]